MLSRFLVLLALAGTLFVGAPLRAQPAPERRFTIEVDSVPVAVALQGPAVVALEDEIRATIEASFGYGLELFGSLPDEFADGPYEEIAISIAEGETRRGESEPARVDMTMPLPEEPIEHVLWKGVLAHEIFHLALRTHDRSVGSDPLQFNYAHDYIINDILRSELGFTQIPAGGLDWPGARRMSAEEIMLQMEKDPNHNRRAGMLCAGAAQQVVASTHGDDFGRRLSAGISPGSHARRG